MIGASCREGIKRMSVAPDDSPQSISSPSNYRNISESRNKTETNL